MSALPKEVESNVIPFKVINGKNKKSEKKNLDGSVKRTHSNKIAGESSEVYAFRTDEEIKAMLDIFDLYISESKSSNQRQIACRNKLLFLIGMNVGIRASDLRTLKWSFFYDEDTEGNRVFKDCYVLQPMKQRKQHKFVKLFFNQTVKKAIENYVVEYPVDDLDTFLFPSRKGDEPITVQSLWRIIKDTATEAGIKQNIGSHSLRKSWGYRCFNQATDKNKALVILQQCFNHSSTQITMKYIGLIDDDISEMYNSIELGYEFI